jgi:hypothetical protein
MASKLEKFGPVHAVTTYTIRVRGEHGCAMTQHANMIEGQADCYLSSRPGGVVDVFYGESCACCGGRGDVPKKGRVLFARRPCPRCAGTGGNVADVLIYSIVGAA